MRNIINKKRSFYNYYNPTYNTYRFKSFIYRGNSMTFSIENIKEARERIAPYIAKTPLLRLYSMDAFLGCEVYVKAECMQITGAFKLRGAMNKTLSLTKDELARGVVTASSGNHGKGVAYAANKLGTKATVVIPRTAPTVKIEAIRALGAEVILCDAAERFDVAREVCEKTGGVMIPPFNDEQVMAGQGTIGLELAEQCPELDRVIVPVAGGGLISGVATAVKACMPKTQVWGAEPAERARYTASLAAGKPVSVEMKYTIADALAATIPGDKCFPVVAANTDGFAAVDDEFLLKGMKLLLTEGKVLAEPSSCIGIGAVLQGCIKVTPGEKVCFVLSGGSVSLEQLDVLKSVSL